MKEELVNLLREHQQVAILISLAASILVAVIGVLPSVFITAANILVFGFWPGTALSFAGEALGAIVAFILYRKGLRKGVQHQLEKYPRVQPLLHTKGVRAFWLIFSLRLLPFVPSGLVTFAGAVGVVSLGTFFLASTLGKLPALLLEAYSVKQVTDFGWQGKLILALGAVAVLYLLFKNRKRKNSRT